MLRQLGLLPEEGSDCGRNCQRRQILVGILPLTIFHWPSIMELRFSAHEKRQEPLRARSSMFVHSSDTTWRGAHHIAKTVNASLYNRSFSFRAVLLQSNQERRQQRGTITTHRSLFHRLPRTRAIHNTLQGHNRLTHANRRIATHFPQIKLSFTTWVPLQNSHITPSISEGKRLSVPPCTLDQCQLPCPPCHHDLPSLHIQLALLWLRQERKAISISELQPRRPNTQEKMTEGKRELLEAARKKAHRHHRARPWLRVSIQASAHLTMHVRLALVFRKRHCDFLLSGKVMVSCCDCIISVMMYYAIQW